MGKRIRKSERIRKHDSTYIISLPNEVIQALSLNESDQLDFIVRDWQVSLEKSLVIKTESVSKFKLNSTAFSLLNWVLLSIDFYGVLFNLCYIYIVHNVNLWKVKKFRKKLLKAKWN